ncbi:hypothetical protein ZYGR_0H02670 [Zygosaccharomyces rouxii]|uniref:ZYRO0B10164p n=2 Tax=Zygosaccharomyces rouxii TaxID=4956 RepID=C5DRP6_ZYGRC|nr:uncharacterized protein ZYRO0B10164g [Zygosaccharomyces rouxii]KAH9200008.1 Sfi1 spindle body protein-domain-containing protein [Zygosaccharomyces rouxii]GAV47425.1 hypothetical protein ZYGR_0H02670 [Zygosaccharomyces rouxii]CAR26457.1 ZYRO0B10164p [Zygosaccharomyces rouxii]
MSFDESTDSILRGADFAQESAGSVSTEALINEDYIGTSTGSLVNKDVRELLDQVFVQVPGRREEDDGVDNDSDNGNDYEDSEDVDRNQPPTSFLLPGSDMYRPLETNGDRPSDLSRKPLTTIAEDMNDAYDQVQNSRKRMGQPQGNPIFSLLFNRIQVFLLRNGMSLEFLKIFKKYIGHMIENGLDPLEDQYFLSLQNELSESFEFTPMMEDILNKFLLRPENLIMKLSLFEHNSAHDLLRRYMKTWKLHGELKRSLAKLAGLWHEYVQRKFLIKWNQKYEEFALHWVHQSQEFNKFTLVSFGFDKWLDKIDSNDARRGLADHYFLNHVFQRIKKRRNALDSRKHRSRDFHDANVMKWTLSKWRLNYRETQFEGTSPSLQRGILERLKQRLQFYQSMNDRADIFKHNWQISPFLKKWHERTKSLDSQSAHLMELEQKFIKGKTIRIFKDQLGRRRQEYAVSEHLDTLFVRFVLQELWFKRFQERLHLYSLWSIQNERIEGKFFAQWKKRLFTDLKAVELARTHALKWHLGKWRSELKCKLFIAKRSQRQQEAAFNKFSERAALEKRARKFQTAFLLKPIFSQWASRRNEDIRLRTIADMSHEQVLKIHFMIYWHHKLIFLRELNQRAEILQRLRAVMMVKKGIAHFQEVKKLGDSFAKLMISKVFLSKHFNIWRGHLALKNQQRLQDLLQSYEQEQQFQLKSNFFSLWNRKSHFYQDVCISRADEIRQRSLQRVTLKAVRQKLQNYAAQVEVSDNFRNNSVTLSTFYIWIVHLNRLTEMNTRLEVEINRKNLALLLNYLNNWSMRILKSRRNYEAVQVFRNRWDRATVRGLLLVWRTRVEHSPGRQEIVQQDFEVKTPIKKLSPKGSNTIPGSEGVKMHRIEAMKSHYSRVRRAIPSPVKSSLSLNSTAKKKIENEEDNVFFSSKQKQQQQNQRLPPPPRLSLERINKNLASKIDRINFERIPEVRLEPFINSDSQFNPIIDRSLLKVEEDEAEFDESPTRRS